MLRRQTIYLNILVVCIILVNLNYGQSYRYYFHGDTRNLSIYRLNLKNGLSKEVIPNLGRAAQFFITPDQSRFIIEDRGRVYAMELDNLNEKNNLYYHQTSEDWVLHFLDGPKTNRLYLMIGDIEDNPKMSIVYNRQTYEILDTLYNLYSLNNLPFLSKNETKIYKLIPDTNGINFKVIGNTGETINEKMQCSNLGPFIFKTRLVYSKYGFGLVVFGYQMGHEYKYYVVCDPDQERIYEPIHFPWRSNGYLMCDGRYVIFEEEQFIDDDDPNTPVMYRPGNFYIFDAQTGKLRKRLKLPPEGEILLFDTHPSQMFYYQPEAPQEPISVDVTQEQPDTDLIDMLISDVNTAYEKGWIDNRGIANSLDKKLENAKKQLEKGKTNTAVSILNAFVNEVEAQKDKHLTSEAYALLKYNAEYLLTKLKEQ